MLDIYKVWGSKLVNTTDSTHNTPLHIAAKKGNINSLKVRRERERERERESKREGKDRTEREKNYVQYMYITFIGVASSLSFKD